MQLAIETTGRVGSVAVLSGERVLCQSKLDPNSRTASTLAPETDRIVGWCEANRHKVGFVSVAFGPGSFTGLRVGVTAAKALSYGLRLPLIGVDSLAAIAAAAFYDHPAVASLLVATNAYRGQLFCGSFSRDALLRKVTGFPNAPTFADENDCPELGGGDSPATRGWSSYCDSVRVREKNDWQQVLDSRPAGTGLVGESSSFGDLAEQLLTRQCDAVGVGLLGIRAAICGDWSDPLRMAPRYMKRSSPEERAESGCL